MVFTLTKNDDAAIEASAVKRTEQYLKTKHEQTEEDK